MKNEVMITNRNKKDKNQNSLLVLHNTDDYSTINEKSIEITKNSTKFDLYKGFIYMFLSCFFKSIFALLMKIELERNPSITSFHLLTFKAYFLLVITVLVALYFFFFNKDNNSNIYIISRNNFNLLALRALFSVTSLSLTTYALKNISISEVYSVYYVYPGIVIILSYFLLKERVCFFDYVCLFASFLGVMLIIRPESVFTGTHSDANHNIMFLYVLIGASLRAVEDIIIRNVGKEIHCLIIPSVYSIVAIAMFPVPMCLNKNYDFAFLNLGLTDGCIIFLISLFSFTYQTLWGLSINNEKVGRVAMINYFQVLFMFISDIFIFDRKIIVYDLIGTFLILFFNIANGIRKASKRYEELCKLKNKTINKEFKENI